MGFLRLLKIRADAHLLGFFSRLDYRAVQFLQRMVLDVLLDGGGLDVAYAPAELSGDQKRPFLNSCLS